MVGIFNSKQKHATNSTLNKTPKYWKFEYLGTISGTFPNSFCVTLQLCVAIKRSPELICLEQVKLVLIIRILIYKQGGFTWIIELMLVFLNKVLEVFCTVHSVSIFRWLNSVRNVMPHLVASLKPLKNLWNHAILNQKIFLMELF